MPSSATLGERIRYIRRKLGLSPEVLAKSARMGVNTLLRLERGEVPAKEWVLGRILKGLGTKAGECFPGVGNIYDYLIPPEDFGSWLRNFRLRKGLQQVELAGMLRVTKVSIFHYEAGVCKPGTAVLRRLVKVYRLEGDKSLRRYLKNGNA